MRITLSGVVPPSTARVYSLVMRQNAFDRRSNARSRRRSIVDKRFVGSRRRRALVGVYKRDSARPHRTHATSRAVRPSVTVARSIRRPRATPRRATARAPRRPADSARPAARARCASGSAVAVRAGASRRWRRRAGAPRRRRASSLQDPKAWAKAWTKRFCVGPSLGVAPCGLQPWAKAPPSLGGALVERNLGKFLKKGPHARAERVRDGLLPARQ